MKKLILSILCVCLFSSTIFAEDANKSDGAMLMCIIIGGSWTNGTCSKPVIKPTTYMSKNQVCNPLVCMVIHHGKCINGVCVPQDSAVISDKIQTTRH